MIEVFVVLFGLVLGSFLNVCIARLPRNESVVSPRSHCPRCGHPIRWYDNVPLLSYVLLGGRCRDCHEPISAVYPLVEALTALLLLADFVVYGWSAEFLRDALFILLLITIIFTDLNERIIPHPVTLTGIVAGLASSWWVRVDSRPLGALLAHFGSFPRAAPLSLMGALVGAAVAGGLFYLVGEVFFRVRGRQGLGFGDVMLMLMVGAFLGLPLALLTVLLGSVLGILVALPFLILDPGRFRHFHWPYGSYLAAAAIYSSLWGAHLLESYLRWSGVVR